jgi:tetratricopeptide (TPR) repeat protein
MTRRQHLSQKEDLLDWVAREPENHRALFIVAAAVQSALHPEENVFGYKGREVAGALVEREMANLRRIAESRKTRNKDVFARVLAVAAIADVVPIDLVGELAAREELGLGFPADSHIGDELEAAGLVVDGAVRAPKPDILAAAFTVKVLARNPKAAPEIIWAALTHDVSGSVERLGRLSFDAEITLQMLEHRLGQWLADAVEDNVERCESLGALTLAAPPIGLLSAAIVICNALLTVAADEKRAGILNNLSNHLRDVGDRAGALEAVREAVEIYRKHSGASPQRYLPDLAMGLNNLSAHLSNMGDGAGALEAIREAVEIRRKLCDAGPRRYLPDLAMSLNNLSAHLIAVGDTAGALEASREAIEIGRKLSDASPQRYRPDLARSLGMLGIALLARNEYREAIEAFAEGIELLRPFANRFPGSPFEKLLNSLTSSLELARKAGQED